ncbi:MAG: hypothetical protein IPH35_05000 [Rhodoferax sp.]|nr:hypothetical protein [Rhodoferax sp.]
MAFVARPQQALEPVHALRCGYDVRRHPEAAARRMAALQDIPELLTTPDVLILGLELIRCNALPAKAEIDAYHVASAAVNGIEYLLTWNCTHIANATTRPKIEATCRALGYEPPIICTPQELTEL